MKPRLREIRVQPAVEGGQQGVLLTDPLGIGQKAMFMPKALALLLTLMDGTRDSGTLRTGFELRTGTPLSDAFMERLIIQLDEALLLENERFARAYEAALNDYRSAACRPAVLAGKCYPSDAGELSAFLRQYLDRQGDEGRGYPGEVKGLVSPHIDFQRGGHIYAGVWSRAEAALRQAELVVILGTDHNDGEGRVTLTRQSYETPLGIVPTAQAAVDEFVTEIGEGVFECELNHRGEHSVEAAVVWLQYLLGDRPCHVLPILCGSFQPFVERRESPLKAAHIGSTIEILKRLTSSQRTVVVAAADLSHVGPVFGDPSPVDIAGRAAMTKQDEELIETMTGGRTDDFFGKIASDGDRRHVCGVPPIYIALSTLCGLKGTPTGYAVCPASEDGTSVVSICGVVYHQEAV